MLGEGELICVRSLIDIPIAEQFFRASQQTPCLFQTRPDLFDIGLAGEYEAGTYFTIYNMTVIQGSFSWFFCKKLI